MVTAALTGCGPCGLGVAGLQLPPRLVLRAALLYAEEVGLPCGAFSSGVGGLAFSSNAANPSHLLITAQGYKLSEHGHDSCSPGVTCGFSLRSPKLVFF